MANTEHNVTEEYVARLTELNDEIAEDLIPAMIFIGLLMILGLVGNLLACFVFVFRLRMSTQHFLIVCLAVFDLLSCTIAMPTEIADMRYFMMFDSEFACRLLRFVNSYCAFASILTLIVIAVDRYRKVCRPLQRQMTLKTVKISVVIVLLVALLFAIPAAVLYGIRTTDTADPLVHGKDCSTNDKVKDTLFPLIYNSVLFLAFLVILVTLTIIYIKIWREMKRHNRYMARNSDANVGRFYIGSLSEMSSVSENHNHSEYVSERVNSNSNGEASPRDDVFTEPGQVDQPAKKSLFWGLRARFKFGSSESEKDLTPKCPSIQSDTTNCDGDSSLNDSMKKTKTQNVDKNTDTPEDTVDTTGNNFSVKSDITYLADENDVKDICKPVQSSGEEQKECAIFGDAVVSVIELDTLHSGSIPSKDSHIDKEAATVHDEGIHDCDDLDRKARGDSQHCEKKSYPETAITASADVADVEMDNSSKECDTESPEEDNGLVLVPENTSDASSDVDDTVENTEELTVSCEQSKNDDEVSMGTGHASAKANSLEVEDTGDNAGTCETADSVGAEVQNTGEEIVVDADLGSRTEASGIDCVPTETNAQNNKTVSKEQAVSTSAQDTTDTTALSDQADCEHVAETDSTQSQEVTTEALKSPTSRSVRIATNPVMAVFIAETAGDSEPNHKDLEPRRPSLPSSPIRSPTSRDENRRPSLPNNVHTHPVGRRPSLVEKMFKHRGSDASRRPSVQSASDENFANGIPKRRLKSTKSVSEVKSYKATVIAMSVTVVFFLSFVPHLSLITSRIVLTDYDRNLKGAALVLYNIFLRSYFINSVSNPIIYGVQNARFRAECVRLFHVIFSCKRKRPASQS